MTYIKLAAIGFAVLALFLGGFYFGGLKARAVLDHSLAAQSATVAAALLAQRAITDAEADRLHGIIAKYEQEPIDPIVPGIAGRLYKYTVRECPVSTPAANTSGTLSTTPQPQGDIRLEQLHQSVFDACAQDAKQLKALIEAWPK